MQSQQQQQQQQQTQQQTVTPQSGASQGQVGAGQPFPASPSQGSNVYTIAQININDLKQHHAGVISQAQQQQQQVNLQKSRLTPEEQEMQVIIDQMMGKTPQPTTGQSQQQQLDKNGQITQQDIIKGATTLLNPKLPQQQATLQISGGPNQQTKYFNVDLTSGKVTVDQQSISYKISEATPSQTQQVASTHEKDGTQKVTLVDGSSKAEDVNTIKTPSLRFENNLNLVLNAEDLFQLIDPMKTNLKNVFIDQNVKIAMPKDATDQEMQNLKSILEKESYIFNQGSTSTNTQQAKQKDVLSQEQISNILKGGNTNQQQNQKQDQAQQQASGQAQGNGNGVRVTEQSFIEQTFKFVPDPNDPTKYITVPTTSQEIRIPSQSSSQGSQQQVSSQNQQTQNQVSPSGSAQASSVVTNVEKQTGQAVETGRIMQPTIHVTNKVPSGQGQTTQELSGSGQKAIGEQSVGQDGIADAKHQGSSEISQQQDGSLSQKQVNPSTLNVANTPLLKPNDMNIFNMPSQSEQYIEQQIGSNGESMDGVQAQSELQQQFGNSNFKDFSQYYNINYSFNNSYFVTLLINLSWALIFARTMQGFKLISNNYYIKPLQLMWLMTLITVYFDLDISYMCNTWLQIPVDQQTLPAEQTLLENVIHGNEISVFWNFVIPCLLQLSLLFVCMIYFFALIFRFSELFDIDPKILNQNIDPNNIKIDTHLSSQSNSQSDDAKNKSKNSDNEQKGNLKDIKLFNGNSSILGTGDKANQQQQTVPSTSSSSLSSKQSRKEKYSKRGSNKESNTSNLNSLNGKIKGLQLTANQQISDKQMQEFVQQQIELIEKQEKEAERAKPLIVLEQFELHKDMQLYHWIVMQIIILVTFIKQHMVTQNMIFLKVTEMELNFNALEQFPSSPRLMCLYTISMLAASKYVGKTAYDLTQYKLLRKLPFYIVALDTVLQLYRRKLIFTLDDYFTVLVFNLSFIDYLTQNQQWKEVFKHLVTSSQGAFKGGTQSESAEFIDLSINSDAVLHDQENQSRVLFMHRFSDKEAESKDKTEKSVKVDEVVVQDSQKVEESQKSNPQGGDKPKDKKVQDEKNIQDKRVEENKAAQEVSDKTWNVKISSVANQSNQAQQSKTIQMIPKSRLEEFNWIEKQRKELIPRGVDDCKIQNNFKTFLVQVEIERIKAITITFQNLIATFHVDLKKREEHIASEFHIKDPAQGPEPIMITVINDKKRQLFVSKIEPKLITLEDISLKKELEIDKDLMGKKEFIIRHMTNENSGTQQASTTESQVASVQQAKPKNITIKIQQSSKDSEIQPLLIKQKIFYLFDNIMQAKEVFLTEQNEAKQSDLKIEDCVQQFVSEYPVRKNLKPEQIEDMSTKTLFMMMQDALIEAIKAEIQSASQKFDNQSTPSLDQRLKDFEKKLKLENYQAMSFREEGGKQKKKIDIDSLIFKRLYKLPMKSDKHHREVFWEIIKECTLDLIIYIKAEQPDKKNSDDSVLKTIQNHFKKKEEKLGTQSDQIQEPITVTVGSDVGSGGKKVLTMSSQMFSKFLESPSFISSKTTSDVQKVLSSSQNKKA